MELNAKNDSSSGNEESKRCRFRMALGEIDTEPSVRSLRYLEFRV